MRNYKVIFFGLLFLASCGKENFQSKPSLKFVSVNTKNLHRQDLIRFNLSFTDKEGDISDSILVIKTNPTCPSRGFQQWYPVPSFPSSTNQKGDITITMGYNVTGYSDVLGPICGHNDTATFSFVLRDLKGNLSDTATSPPIVIYQ